MFDVAIFTLLAIGLIGFALWVTASSSMERQRSSCTMTATLHMVMILLAFAAACLSAVLALDRIPV